MKQTTYRRIVRRRLEAALRLKLPAHAPTPVMDQMADSVPPEIIDLATGPFETRFPELARKRRRR